LWADINEQDPSIIDLEGANKSARED